MDFLHNYYRQSEDGKISVSAKQGSGFAKQIADDFNPIHHSDSRRFCVPGDLLFSIAVERYGLRANMSFRFLDLLSADVDVKYPPQEPDRSFDLQLMNAAGKATLGIQYSGEADHNEQRQASLVRNYVAFSGHNFPDILVPLMRDKNVMFNPKRPLVIYESMHLSFEHFDFSELQVELAETSLEVNGKRGDARLNFNLRADQAMVGKGYKTLILSGLRDYQEDAIASMCAEYAASKIDYTL